MSDELKNHWEVLAEPIQMILRKHGIADAYERLKEFTRGQSLTEESIKEFVNSLSEISEEDKKKTF